MSYQINSPTQVRGPRFGARHLQILLLFLAIVVNYGSRLNISISLVAMTDAKTTNPNFHEFDWNEKQKPYILISFFWGYTLFQLPGGYAARRIGVKKTILIVSFTNSIFREVILKNKWTSLLVLRKTINTIATWGTRALLIGIGLLDENQRALAIIFITLNVGLDGGHIIESLMNLIDISPNHAGILMALLNTLSSILAVMSPIVMGISVQDETDRFQWMIVFLITAGVLFFGNLQFLFFAQTKAQPWNDENFLTKS